MRFQKCMKPLSFRYTTKPITDPIFFLENSSISELVELENSAVRNVIEKMLLEHIVTKPIADIPIYPG